MLRRLFTFRRSQRPGKYGREFAVGDVIEQRYEIEKVRRGFMGIVYIAYDRQRRRRIVLKTFQNKFLWDNEALKRFNAEVELWMRLGSHPNIVRALDLCTFLGKPHVVAEYVHGGALRTLIGHLSFREALQYALQICWGMHYAVEQVAVLHRDLKPDNIMVTLDGQIKVTDFGLAKVLPRWQWQAHQLDPRSTVNRMRQVGTPDVLSGTLPYMAPELFEASDNLGPWTDIYAFGVTLYELFTGRLPFDSTHDESLMRMHLRSSPPDPRIRVPDLPDAAVTIVMRCLAKRPSERYRAWSEVEEALQEIYRMQFGHEYYAEFIEDDLAASERLVEQGLAHMKLAEHNDARRCFAEATERDRSRAEPWALLAQVRLRLWEYNEALAAVNEGLRRAVSRTEFGQLFEARGAIYAKMELPERALTAYDEALSYTPNAPTIWREKGTLLLHLERTRDAEQCTRHAISLDRLDPQAWAQLGAIELRHGNARRAYDAYAEALRLNPRNADLWVCYGWCQLQMARVRDARNSFTTALEIDPDHAEAHEGMRRVR